MLLFEKKKKKMKLNPLKIISLTLSSGLFLSSIPVKAESIKSSYGDLNTNSLNNTLIAGTDTPIQRGLRVKRFHVKKNGRLKMLLNEPVNSIEGSIILNSREDAVKYLARDAKIKNKTLIWENSRNSNILENTNVKINTSNLIVNNQKLIFSNGNAISNASIGSGIGAAGLIGGLIISGIVIGASSGGSGTDVSN